jgi:transcriptional regulator with GAF, ATPase, and Fis domain
MQAMLLTISGPLSQSVINCDEQTPVTMGRGPSNSVVLKDQQASREHCVVESSPAGFRVRDLDSRNGTWVNGQRITEHDLNSGDHLWIGGSVFIFVYPDQAHVEPSTPIEVTSEEQDAPLPPEGDESPATERLLTRTVRDLHLLSRVASKIGEIKDPEALLHQTVWALFESIPVDRCAVVLIGDASEEIRSVAAWNKSNPLSPVRVSRTALRRVIDSKTGFLSRDVAADPSMVKAVSVDMNTTRSVLCVPIADSHRVIGAIYAESDDVKSRLDDQHLQLMNAIASLAGLQYQNALRSEVLVSENSRLRKALGFDTGLVGDSSAMQEILRKITKLAETRSTALIIGETGTGKELVARALHQASSIAHKPFVAVNCAAITETLLESELFGHEKGAFTGAENRRRGFFEQADTGTIFLDEVGELAPSAQVKLLRVLQQREVVRVGSSQPIKIDVRVIAATHRDLAAMVKQGQFREDLYYRLNVVTIQVPPLRNRMDDLSALAQHLVQKYSASCNRNVRGVSRDAMECMRLYTWPGNIRELENVIERAVVLGSSDTILPEDLPETLFEAPASVAVGVPNFHASVAQHKRDIILRAVQQAQGNLSEAARLLGLHPNYLHRLVTTMDLRSKITTTSSS